jgi:hypothetical protein
MLRVAPPLPFIPETLRGKRMVALMVCHAGPIDEGERLLRPLRQFGRPSFDSIAPVPYADFQQLLDAALPHGRHYYQKAWSLPPLTNPVISLISEHAMRITTPFSVVPIFTFGGAVARVAADVTAYPNRTASHEINITAAWAPGDDRARHVAWTREFWSALEPFARGVYVNFVSDEAAGGLAAVYGASAYPRLVALKRKVDPTNFFRFNQNIEP